ncbi:MAG TPA: GntR family transcriptional regulator [Candidatus Lachnoclostridium stercoravium]|uniref:GntR family transcriptional regulator n=1 Tax=Candidatus Lachnoclostridium stercoravium TaxID=2838633 RepID=A0A9D2HGI3_9FIRM|nr:GntR family transcriptional regulator [Candidatus Lachnoclostridium stercoravium]
MEMKTGKNLSIAESVYDYIVELILTQQIKPGERIPEADVGQKLGVSRTPVREAIRRLESEGLVVVSTNRCVEVISFDEQSLVNIGVMRLALEQTSIRLAVYRGSNEDFNQLYEIAAACNEAAQAGKVSERIHLDTKFHLALAQIGNNPLLVRYLTQLLRQVELIQSTRYVDASDAVIQISDHYPIVDALVARDEKKALEISSRSIIEYYHLDTQLPIFNLTDSL